MHMSAVRCLVQIGDQNIVLGLAQDVCVSRMFGNGWTSTLTSHFVCGPKSLQSCISYLWMLGVPCSYIFCSLSSLSFRGSATAAISLSTMQQ